MVVPDLYAPAAARPGAVPVETPPPASPPSGRAAAAPAPRVRAADPRGSAGCALDPTDPEELAADRRAAAAAGRGGAARSSSWRCSTCRRGCGRPRCCAGGPRSTPPTPRPTTRGYARPARTRTGTWSLSPRRRSPQASSPGASCATASPGARPTRWRPEWSTSPSRSTTQRHAELHRLGVDVFRRRPGRRAADRPPARCRPTRTWRQLTVRRLLLLVERAVRRQLAVDRFRTRRRRAPRRAAHAPRRPARRTVRRGRVRRRDAGGVVVRPRRRAGADRGRTTGSSSRSGVAPSAPLEFLVVRVALDADGSDRAAPRRRTRG